MLSLYDIDDKFIYKLFEWIRNKQLTFTSEYDSTYRSSQMAIAMANNTERLVMCSYFLKNLTSSMQLAQSSTFLRFPRLNQGCDCDQDSPITYLLKSFSSAFQTTPTDASENLSQMKNDVPTKICCFQIPLKLIDKVKTVKKHSYALVFMLRYDNDLMRFESAHSN